MTKDLVIVCLWCLPGSTQIVLPLLMGAVYLLFTTSKKLYLKLL